LDYQFKEDRKTAPTLKNSSISPRKKIFPVPTLFITSLLEEEQTSKHGGGGRYDAILEYKGEQIKIFDEKNEKEKKEGKRNMRKRKKYEYV
jgi:hypothetical protein